jgi:hypothetical protein
MIRTSSVALGWLTLALVACTGDVEGSGGGTSTTTTSGGPTTSGPTTTTTGGTTSSTTGNGGTGGGSADPCAGALFCETFEDYSDVSTLADAQTFGPWRAAVDTNGGSLELDDAHTTSGTRALHTRIESGTSAGGRLFANGDLPLFAGGPTHLYGRMMMYIDPNGTSVHWTFFGASGDAEPGSPEVGRRATYLMSSLPRDGVNTYSFVYGLEGTNTDPYHDCWFQSEGAMPTGEWTCVQFEMDSVARSLRMWTGDPSTPTVAVDDIGQGCVGDVPGDSPWYGPVWEEIYLGAWSFHDMDAPLEVWIDDLAIGTAPLPCP